MQIFLVFLLAGFAAGDNFDIVPFAASFAAEPSDVPNINAQYAYCFQFTWLGSRYTNETFTSVSNKTCNDIFSTIRPEPLCVNPMIGTYSGTPPDTKKMWNQYGGIVACRVTEGQVCAKFTYLQGGKVQNVTRYCTQIILNDSSNLKSGCVRDSRDGVVKEVCACKSVVGQEPCNSAFKMNFPMLTIISFILAMQIFWKCYG